MTVDNVGADQKRKSGPVVSQRRVGAQSSAVSPSIRRLRHGAMNPAGRLRCNIMPIAKGYDRVSQPPF
jgi:hypothetical protein